MFYPLLPDVDDMLRTISLTALTVMKKTTLVHHISGLLPVVGFPLCHSVSSNLVVVLARWVEPLELPGLVVAHVISQVLCLRPVDISGLRGEPSNVGCDKSNTNTHDDGKGLEGDVVLEGFDGQALHQLQIVVGHPASLAHQVGVVSSCQNLCKDHLSLL